MISPIPVFPDFPLFAEYEQAIFDFVQIALWITESEPACVQPACLAE